MKRAMLFIGVTVITTFLLTSFLTIKDEETRERISTQDEIPTFI